MEGSPRRGLGWARHTKVRNRQDLIYLILAFSPFFVAQTRKSRAALAWDDLMPSRFSILLKEGQASKVMAFASGGRGRCFIFRCFIFRCFIFRNRD